MKYLKSAWFHDFEDEAVLWYHEIGDDGYEIRRIMIFKDRRVVIVSKEHETDDNYLSPEIFASVDEINESPEFEATEISPAEFQELWMEQIYKR